MSTRRKKQSRNPRLVSQELMEEFQKKAKFLLGCEWGRSLSTPDDEDVCGEKAVQIVAVHNGPAVREFKLCAKHIERIEQETTPHASD